MNASKHSHENPINHQQFANACIASCQNLIAQIKKTREAILVEFRKTLEVHEHLLRLALNEAEALAWQTDFPQLIFPSLALEKVQAVAAWHARQHSRQQTHPGPTFAA